MEWGGSDMYCPPEESKVLVHCDSTTSATRNAQNSHGLCIQYRTLTTLHNQCIKWTKRQTVELLINSKEVFSLEISCRRWPNGTQHGALGMWLIEPGLVPSSTRLLGEKVGANSSSFVVLNTLYFCHSFVYTSLSF